MVESIEMASKEDEEAWTESPTNPRNWSLRRKWTITLTACYMSSLINIAASSYSLGEDSMAAEFHVSKLLVVSGISFFTLGVAIFPLILAPIGEEIGRRYVYLISYGIFFLFFLPIALARNIQTVLISRFICGAAGSVGSTMVSNTTTRVQKNTFANQCFHFFLSLSLSLRSGAPCRMYGQKNSECISDKRMRITLISNVFHFCIIPDEDCQWLSLPSLPCSVRQSDQSFSAGRAPMHPGDGFIGRW
jgi:hypothetical protein